ncbi:MAG: enoyl-CoA hydratase/isomerase family protein [Acidobacteria bacterium]|nr:enoyl-CoA hydratase/isomerase family protein [Acidobacteriota bacterium]MBI3654863.1 enoyl-CoA hydratase/isomerase family protein [Acidobacteriota bacterium]
MSYHNLRVEKREGIAYITINRPEKLNALNGETVAELEQAAIEVKNDAAVRAVIITGQGEKAFVAGADINELARQTPGDGAQTAQRGQRIFAMLENLGKPVIAAINGFALGGGCELALACTVRIASTNAKLGQPEIKLGIIPGYGGTQRLPRLVGKGIAQELLLSGKHISAEEAYRIGLVNRVVPPAELMATAESMAREFISHSPVTLRYCIEAVNKGLEMTLEEGCYLEATLFGLVCASEDMREGTQAFIDKRKPEFKGK